EKPRNTGFYINIITSLKDDFKMAQAQIRLMALDMDKYELEDRYGMDRHQQEELFINIVQKYANVPDWAIRRFF
ncbi:MAG: hypothetical protein PHW55_12100, partial [Methanothrix sp.]|nr:hypothetical protein [Methanothrix sp.]